MNDQSQKILLPRDAARFITENSQDVRVSTDGIFKIAELISNNIKSENCDININRWNLHELNPQKDNKSAIDWVFLSDVINFSFWSEDESNKYVVIYKGKSWTGYWSLCAAINRALDEGIPITDPTYYRSITIDQLKYVLRSDSDTDIPLIEERQKALQEAGMKLCNDYDGSFVNVIQKAEKSCQKLLLLISSEFSSFRDITMFKNKMVAIYKRAQILIADIWACCNGKGYGEFRDIDTITMFADYRVPQVLAWFGATKYSEELYTLLKDPVHKFNSGDRLEVEIRGCSIYAVDRIVEEVNKMTKCDADVQERISINAILVHQFLWDYRRQHSEEAKHVPIHRIRSIYY